MPSLDLTGNRQRQTVTDRHWARTRAGACVGVRVGKRRRTFERERKIKI